MKKQYMDFVPARSARVVRAKPKNQAKAGSSVRTKANIAKGSTTTKRTPETKQTGSAGGVGFTGEKQPKLGKIENLNTRFVRSDVPKRPLSRLAHFTTAKSGIVATKAKNVGLKSVTSTSVKPVEKPVENSRKLKTYQTPKNPFVNKNKVQKRPLSKNVYAKKEVAPPKEAEQGPVTIISKPDKPAHAGTIVTIILTIILGAAAGTVAFLLMPK